MKENQKLYRMETEPVHTLLGGTRGGTSITDIDKMTDAYGSEMVDYFFTEYFMRMVAKSKLLDRITDAVNGGADIKEIKEILYGTDNNSSDKAGIIV